MRNSTFISLDSTSCDIVTHIMHIVQSAFSNIKTHSWHLLCLWMLEMYGEYDGLPSTQKVCSFKNIGKRSKLECGGRIRRWTVDDSGPFFSGERCCKCIKSIVLLLMIFGSHAHITCKTLCAHYICFCLHVMCGIASKNHQQTSRCWDKPLHKLVYKWCCTWIKKYSKIPYFCS